MACPVARARRRTSLVGVPAVPFVLLPAVDAEAAVAGANLEGAILGKALCAGRFTLDEPLPS